MKRTRIDRVRIGPATRWLLTVAGSAAIASLFPVAPLAAQLRISPWVGLYAPASDVGSIRTIDFGKKESTLAYGADLDFGGGLLGFRLGGGYATNSEVDFNHSACGSCTARATVLTATGALVLTPLPLPAIRPYVVTGAGWKWYDFELAGSFVDALSDQAKFTWQVGAGARLSPGSGLGLFAELSDFVNRIDLEDGLDGNTQHDFVFKAGISIRAGTSE